jgi:flagellin
MPIDSVTAINGNAAAQRTARILADASLALQKSMLRASSGLRITSPEVDAAGLAQFAKLDAQISRLDAGQSNVANAVSFSETQDGALRQAQGALNRMGELSIAAQDPTKNTEDLANIQQEFGQLQSFVGGLSSETFNGVNLFSNSGQAVTSDGEGGQVAMAAVDLAAAGNAGGLSSVASGISVSTPTNAAAALTAIQTSIQNVANARATVGADIQRLNITSETNSIRTETLSAASSRIKDSDIAVESTRLGSYKLLVQSGVASLKLINQAPKSTLQLLA